MNLVIRVQRIETDAGKDTARVIFRCADSTDNLDKGTSMSEFGVDVPKANAPELGSTTTATI